MAIWNKKDLQFPPISTYRVETNDIDLNYFHKICKETKEFFDSSEFMNAEYSVLSRIIYRMKQKFRSSKDFKSTEKVCKSLKSYFDINVVPHLETLIDLIHTNKQESYLPSKNILDFLLVKMQGISKLLDKIVVTSMEAAGLLFTRIKIGHFWKVGFIAYSIIARISVLAKNATNKVCEFYNKLIPFSKKLQCTTKWLPEDYKLPKDLKKWLNTDWLELEEDVQLINNSTDLPDIPFFDLVDDDDDDIEFCDEYILISDDQRKSRDKSEVKNVLRGFEFSNDIGEIIQLDESITIPSSCPNLSISNSLKENLVINKPVSKKRKRKRERQTDVDVGDHKSRKIGVGSISSNVLNTKLKNKKDSYNDDIIEVLELSDTDEYLNSISLNPPCSNSIKKRLKNKIHTENRKYKPRGKELLENNNLSLDFVKKKNIKKKIKNKGALLTNTAVDEIKNRNKNLSYTNGELLDFVDKKNIKKKIKNKRALLTNTAVDEIENRNKNLSFTNGELLEFVDKKNVKKKIKNKKAVPTHTAVDETETSRIFSKTKKTKKKKSIKNISCNAQVKKNKNKSADINKNSSLNPKQFKKRAKKQAL